MSMLLALNITTCYLAHMHYAVLCCKRCSYNCNNGLGEITSKRQHIFGYLSFSEAVIRNSCTDFEIVYWKRPFFPNSSIKCANQQYLRVWMNNLIHFRRNASINIRFESKTTSSEAILTTNLVKHSEQVPVCKLMFYFTEFML